MNVVYAMAERYRLMTIRGRCPHVRRLVWGNDDCFYLRAARGLGPLMKLRELVASNATRTRVLRLVFGQRTQCLLNPARVSAMIAQDNRHKSQARSLSPGSVPGNVN